MTEVDDVQVTRRSYDALAEQYEEMARNIMAENPFDRAALSIFAELVHGAESGPVVDLGCGPGRITAHLSGLGLDVSGIDLSPEMIRLARKAYPDLRFEEGAIESLPMGDGSTAAVVAWYSIIHTPPQRVPAVLTELARTLRAGGYALFGFQSAVEPGVIEYQHRVATSYRWNIDSFADVLSRNGFRVIAQLSREARPDERTPQAWVLAVKN
ncbi:class I SAM-dependent DNA methyltransferase [Nocardia jejuensis]|uniref:class I SAM-dependent DNA methyltransferase n=1 Tax=Nocardia jejuensis TaxID=328049 RepID=UPI00083414EE|nr:class I SAM-dependent methyltransferase [Nocardia jejuensis]